MASKISTEEANKQTVGIVRIPISQVSTIFHYSISLIKHSIITILKIENIKIF
jgi:hypothetical protein